jgi:hypothetical protein
MRSQRLEFRSGRLTLGPQARDDSRRPGTRTMVPGTRGAARDPTPHGLRSIGPNDIEPQNA